MTTGQTVEATFCFVDIAGYTALTDTHGETAAADLVDVFTGLVQKSIEGRGQLQELIGDCAYLVFPDPVAAYDSLLALYGAIVDRENFPVIRTGLHHGSALFRNGRYFGTTVNLAARVTAEAMGGHIFCTRSVADVLAQARPANAGIRFHGSVSLKNLLEPVELFEIVPSSCEREYAIDPVCKMQVDTRSAAGDLHFNGRTYWFCSLECVERFARQPAAYT